MKVEFYGHVRQYHNIKSEIDQNLQTVLESSQYVMGPMLKRFESELAAYHGTKYAIGLGNGTDAIWLALMALGVGPGDEVITVPSTFMATAEAITFCGAKPVFVDEFTVADEPRWDGGHRLVRAVHADDELVV